MSKKVDQKKITICFKKCLKNEKKKYYNFPFYTFSVNCKNELTIFYCNK